MDVDPDDDSSHDEQEQDDLGFGFTSMTEFTSRTIALEYQRFIDDPADGILVKLFDERSLFTWEVVIFGPPDSFYAGGYFKGLITFPENYPYVPPRFQFFSKMYHPNIRSNGTVDLSVLKFYNNDSFSDKSGSYSGWNPWQSARTFLMSIIRIMLNPEVESIVNDEAGKLYQCSLKEFETTVKNLVQESQKEAAINNVFVPIKLGQYCNMCPPPPLPDQFKSLISNESILNELRLGNPEALLKQQQQEEAEDD